jgi:hypothetical protein
VFNSTSRLSPSPAQTLTPWIASFGFHQSNQLKVAVNHKLQSLTPFSGLLCTWPKGGALSLPFVYSNEVWTGIEYQVASHLMLMGRVAEGLEIVRTCRARYDGRVRNPFDEYECGHWYARALSSYGLLQGLSGARYDAVEQVLHLAPSVAGDFRCFLATATGYGTVGVKDGRPFLEVASGQIAVKSIDYVKRA